MNKPGECRICRCAGDCRLASGDECMWTDASRTLCTNDNCMREARRRRSVASVSKKKQPRPSPWQVVRRDPQTGRATRIVKNRNFKWRGRAA